MDIECWGIRFGWLNVWLHCGRDKKKFDEKMDLLAKDLKEYDGFVMQAEDDDKPYAYLMFRGKDLAEGFFEKHKREELYKMARVRFIKEPAYIPEELLKDENIGKT